jgi:RNA polymerase sigma factor (sigma-70 family)
MNSHEDQCLIDGIAAGNSIVIEKIYKKYSLTITSYVLKNSGTIEDAQDLFQEGIMVIYNISQKKEIQLTCSFLTYINAICRRLWWKKLRGKTHETVELNDVAFSLVENNLELDSKEKYEFYKEKLQLLKPKKRQMLELYFDGKRMAEIAQIMGLKSEGYARKFKYQCKKAIEELVQQDQRYLDFHI